MNLCEHCGAEMPQDMSLQQAGWFLNLMAHVCSRDCAQAVADGEEPIHKIRDEEEVSDE